MFKGYYVTAPHFNVTSLDMFKGYYVTAPHFNVTSEDFLRQRGSLSCDNGECFDIKVIRLDKNTIVIEDRKRNKKRLYYDKLDFPYSIDLEKCYRVVFLKNKLKAIGELL